VHHFLWSILNFYPPETLSALAAILLSLAFSYIPGLSDKFAALDGTLKRLIMLACLLVISLGSDGLACSGVLASLVPSISCTQSGIIAVLQSFILATVANQSTYLVSPRRSKRTPLPSREGAGG
jgi:hypothetical protein